MKDKLKIVVVSDSHGDNILLGQIALKHSDADYFLHLGDSELEPYQISPFVSVLGNSDRYSLYPETKRIVTPLGDIFMEHGLKLSRIGPNYISAQDATIYLYGHTHVHSLTKIDSRHYVANPGSITRPRDGTSGTYLVITLSKEDPTFEFIEL